MKKVMCQVYSEKAFYLSPFNSDDELKQFGTELTKEVSENLSVLRFTKEAPGGRALLIAVEEAEKEKFIEFVSKHCEKCF